MRLVLTLCCWLALTWAGGSAAATPSGPHFPEPGFKVIQLDQTVHFTHTTATTVARIERKALNAEGARAIGTFSLPVNQALETLDILDAYTVKTDGTRIRTAPGSQWTQYGRAPEESGGPRWPHTNVRHIHFANVGPGDRTILHLRRHQHTPALPGWISLSEVLSPSIEFDAFRLRIEAPPDLPLHVVASGMSLDHAQVDGTQVWTATASSRTPTLHRDGVTPASPPPRLLASTYANHEMLAHAYASQSRPMARVTPGVRALARQITREADRPLTQARAIHDWVRRHIRYDAVYLGVGGWTPRDAQEILRTRFGDCKDQVLLMQALLAAVSIEAVPALVHTNDDYTLSELPVAFSFNHVILYLPQWQLFLDPTASDVPFGALPWSSAGKPAAVALADGGRILNTPVFRAEDNQLSITTTLTIRPDGSAHTTTHIAARGHAATLVRDYLTRIPAGMDVFVVPGLLRQRGLQGTGQINHSPAHADDLVQDLDLEADMVNLRDDLENQPLTPGPVVPLPFSILIQMGGPAAASRPGRSVCAPMIAREDFELHLPTGLQIRHHPVDLVETHPDGIHFEARYSYRDLIFRGHRELVLSHARHGCSSADNTSRRPTLERIIRHLKENILFQH